MESLHYLVLVNLYLLLFYGFYHLLLRNETFFRLNRIYLVGTALMSFLIPFIQLDWLKALFITNKVQEVTFIYSMMETPTYMPVEQTAITTGDVLTIIYLIGSAFFTIRFIIQMIRIQIHLNKTNRGEAFSFFRNVKVDPELADHEIILEHEQVHARQLHSADVILFEIIAIMNWFNPVVYLYKKAIKNLHEFTADEVASAYAVSKNSYSIILFSNAFGVEPHQLTNSFFNQSLLKQRIYMLNKTKSKKAAILKYGLSAPLFAGMLILSSATIKEKVEASEQIAKLEPHNLSVTVTEVIPKAINKSFKFNRKISYKTTPSEIVNQQDHLTTLTDTVERAQDFASIDILPEFPGGQEGFGKYIMQNFTYSSEARKLGVSGKVIISFVVEKDGDLTDIKVLRDMGLGTGPEAVRVLEESPKWKPGMQKGKLVRVMYVLPIVLRLEVEGQETGTTNQPQSPNVLYVVDGKEVKKDVVDAFKPADILSMNVLNDKFATDKYGDKGKNGAIEITTKTANDNSLTGVKIQSTNKNQNIDFKGLVFIDGKEKDNSKGDALKSLKPEDIKSMNVIEGEEAIKKYGQKAKDGAIEITLKKE